MDYVLCNPLHLRVLNVSASFKLKLLFTRQYSAATTKGLKFEWPFCVVIDPSEEAKLQKHACAYKMENRKYTETKKMEPSFRLSHPLTHAHGARLAPSWIRDGGGIVNSPSPQPHIYCL
ncbi:hypothetical protein D5086_025563 [Populus alba]|uniref:Uncharacterized protein n=1 Tax=Populus alba TaxID=43335 RepID=A0ACC4B0E7_POPAL